MDSVNRRISVYLTYTKNMLEMFKNPEIYYVMGISTGDRVIFFKESKNCSMNTFVFMEIKDGTRAFPRSLSFQF